MAEQQRHADRRLVVAGAIAGAALAAVAIRAAGPPFWLWWQWAIILAAAAELSGGLVASALQTTGSSGGDWRRLAFAAIQLHLPLVAMVVPGAMPARAAWLGYVWLVGGTAVMLALPARWRLAMGLALTAVGTVLMARSAPLDALLGWLPILIFLRVLVAPITAPDAH